MVFNLIVVGKIIDLTLFAIFTCSIVCMIIFSGFIGSFTGLFGSSVSLGFELLSSSSFENFPLIIICKSFHIL